MKIGILGLGLIGGSVYKKLLSLNKYAVIGVTQNSEKEEVDYSKLVECDIVFVCVPMNAALETLDKLNDILTENTLVTDVCSLKEFLSHKTYNFRFLPSHPMAGSEKQGFENSYAEMFEGAKWIFTPLDNNKENDIEILKNIINDLGAEVVYATPKEHDRAVALISNLPLVVSQALCMNIENDEFAKLLASSGFRDTTRLAMSNCEMANDMVTINRKNIDSAIKSFITCLEGMLGEDYIKHAERIKTFRKELYK